MAAPRKAEPRSIKPAENRGNLADHGPQTRSLLAQLSIELRVVLRIAFQDPLD
jgi:hypothetical protein